MVELMVVVSIIAILSSFALQSYINYIKRSRTAEAMQHCRMLYHSIIDWYNTPEYGNGKFPATYNEAGVRADMRYSRAFPQESQWWSIGDHYYDYELMASTSADVPPKIRATAKGGLDSNKIFVGILESNEMGNVSIIHVSSAF